MTDNEILSSEKPFIAKLTDREREVYTCDEAMQAKLRASNDYNALNFLDKVRLLNALNLQHTHYNKIFEEPIIADTDVEQLMTDSMHMTISIGWHAIVVDLTIMDDCDAVYCMLATLKMHAFEWLADNFDIDSLFHNHVAKS